ncbi:hypothetical protein [Hafnia phage yong3]|nr:hypothetical protein [Hafnia phage yong3]
MSKLLLLPMNPASTINLPFPYEKKEALEVMRKYYVEVLNKDSSSEMGSLLRRILFCEGLIE